VKLPWATARDNCASIGMQMVRVDEAGENQFLVDNVYASPPLQGLWLGATDAPVEGEWRWPDGELFWLGDRNGTAQSGLYSGWFPGTQPSAQQTVRDCAILDLSGGDGGWYDSDCTFSMNYLCESL
jgi:hypothetical protein